MILCPPRRVVRRARGTSIAPGPSCWSGVDAPLGGDFVLDPHVLGLVPVGGDRDRLVEGGHAADLLATLFDDAVSHGFDLIVDLAALAVPVVVCLVHVDLL